MYLKGIGLIEAFIRFRKPMCTVLNFKSYIHSIPLNLPVKAVFEYHVMIYM